MIDQISHPTGEFMHSVAVSSEGKFTFSASKEEIVKTDLVTGETVASAETIISHVVVSDLFVVTCAGYDDAVKVWSFDLELQTFENEDYDIWSAAVSPDSTTIVSGDGDGGVKI